MKLRLALCAVALFGYVGAAAADTTDSKWQSRVVIAKQGVHCVDDPNCFNRYHPDIPAVSRAKPGDMIVGAIRRRAGFRQVALEADSDARWYLRVDLNLSDHQDERPLEHIRAPSRGDVLSDPNPLVDIAPDAYGYTVDHSRFRFPARHLHASRYLVAELAADAHPRRVTPIGCHGDQGVRGPAHGSVGVLPRHQLGGLDSRLARETALRRDCRRHRVCHRGGIGNQPSARSCGLLDRQGYSVPCARSPLARFAAHGRASSCRWARHLLLPCFVDGCGLFVGDVHYAQGDGEVSGTAIETGAVVTVVTEIRKGQGSFIKGPEVEGGAQIKDIEPSKFYQTIGLPLKAAGAVPPQHTYLESQKIENLSNLSEDLTVAARDALIKMIAYIQREHGLDAEQAYILASVAVDLRVGQVVDVPNYIVTAVLNEDVFAE